MPCGAAALALLLLIIPRDFPDLTVREKRQKSNNLVGVTHRNIDFLGFLLLLLASIFLVTALEEAGTQFHLSSALIKVSLVVSGLARGRSLGLGCRAAPNLSEASSHMAFLKESGLYGGRAARDDPYHPKEKS